MFNVIIAVAITAGIYFRASIHIHISIGIFIFIDLDNNICIILPSFLYPYPVIHPNHHSVLPLVVAIIVYYGGSCWHRSRRSLPSFHLICCYFQSTFFIFRFCFFLRGGPGAAHWLPLWIWLHIVILRLSFSPHTSFGTFSSYLSNTYLTGITFLAGESRSTILLDSALSIRLFIFFCFF